MFPNGTRVARSLWKGLFLPTQLPSISYHRKANRRYLDHFIVKRKMHAYWKIQQRLDLLRWFVLVVEYLLIEV